MDRTRGSSVGAVARNVWSLNFNKVFTASSATDLSEGVSSLSYGIFAPHVTHTVSGFKSWVSVINNWVTQWLQIAILWGMLRRGANPVSAPSIVVLTASVEAVPHLNKELLLFGFTLNSGLNRHERCRNPVFFYGSNSWVFVRGQGERGGGYPAKADCDCKN